MDMPVSSNLLAQEMESLLICSCLKIGSSLNCVARVSGNAFSSVLDVPGAVQFVTVFQAEYRHL